MKHPLNRLFCILLALMLLLFSACGKPTDSSSESDSASEPTETVLPESTPEESKPAESDPSPSAETETKNEEPFQGGSSKDETPAEKSGDIVILYTSDVHCGVDQGFGYAGLQEVRRYLLSQGDEVILVDNGDNIQGEAIGTMTKGEIPLDLMNKMGYSVAIPGNHEFDYGMEQFLSLAEKAEFDYISCNFNLEGELLFKPYVIRELAGKKVGFVGVTTPKTLTSSTPSYFQDENGEFIYGFLQDDTGEGVYQAIQDAVDSARNEGADHVVVMGHLGYDLECAPWNYMDIVSNTSGFEVLLDGHSHDSEQVSLKNKEGKIVLRSACGTKLTSIGWCRISKDGDVSTGLYTWNNSVSLPELLGIRNEISNDVTAAITELENILKEVVAISEVNLTINDPVEVTPEGTPIRMIRRAETNLGDFCADAYRSQSGADVAIAQGGSIRVSIDKGDVTLLDIFNVHPFGNELCVLEVSGQQLLDALEWGARAVPSENGGFLQVSGLSYEIHSYIDDPCKENSNSMFESISGERRVRNVLIHGEPLEPEKKYTLGGLDYLLLDSGDGFSMFKGAPILQDRVKIDNQVLLDYITESLGGIIGEDYEDPYGDGRIVIIDEEP